jgi:putative transposase
MIGRVPTLPRIADTPCQWPVSYYVMAKRFRFDTDHTTYFLTFVVWKRMPVFGISKLTDIAIATLRFYLEREDFDLHSYVIMPDHIHLLLSANHKIKPGQIVGRVKSYISHRILDENRIDLHGQIPEFSTSLSKRLWVPRFDETTIRNLEMGMRCIDYIHSNPVKAGLVSTATDFPYSSAHFYETGMVRSCDLPISPLL